MEDSSIDVSKLKWAENMTKRSQDPKLFRMMAPVLSQLDKVRMLSLPASDWAFETALSNVFTDTDLEFVGVDRNEEVAEQMIEAGKTLSRKNRQFKGQPASTVMKALKNTEEPFDLVYLDYMGTWSQEKLKDLKYLINNDLVTQLYAVTIQLKRGRPETQKDIEKFALKEDRDILGFMVMDTQAPSVIEQGSHSNMKVFGVPAWIEEEFHQRGKSCRCTGGVIYDSWSTINPSRYTPEMTMVFDLR